MTTKALAARAQIEIDLGTGRLLRGGEAVPLRPKAWELLCFLAERPGRLITKEEILDAVWADTVVSEAVLSKTVSELRLALDDSRKPPALLETVSRRGFRWLGDAGLLRRPGGATPEPAAAPVADDTRDPGLIGREDELAALEAALARATAGRRQLVFVTGEGGAGKTTLVERFLERAGRAGSSAPLVAQGQCLPFSGSHEPYICVFDALEALARRTTEPPVTSILERFAPGWLQQMPSLRCDEAAGATSSQPGSMPREFLTAIAEIGRHRPLVLVLEDVHWADLATTDLCHLLARQNADTRLLLVLTMRTADAVVAAHPLLTVKSELKARGLATELGLEGFASEEIEAYLDARCPGLLSHERERGAADARALVDWLGFQSAGNPLFVRLVMDDWIARGLVRESEAGRWQLAAASAALRAAVPDSLRSLLERRLSQLTPVERTLLEAASVQGGEFDAASVAACTDSDPEAVEELCNNMVRRGQLLRFAGSGKAATGRYDFVHAIVRQVVEMGLASAQRRRLHLAAAAHLERVFDGRLEAAAPLLAAHYEEAGDVSAAVRHLCESARIAVRRDSVADAVATLEKALALVDAAETLENREAERLAVLEHLVQSTVCAYGFLDARVQALVATTRRLAGNSNENNAAALGINSEIAVTFFSGRYREAERLLAAALAGPRPSRGHPAYQYQILLSALLAQRFGRFDEARAFFEQAVAADAELIPDETVFIDVTSQALTLGALLRLQTGDEAGAREWALAGLARSKGKGNIDECIADLLSAEMLALLGDFAAAAPLAARAADIAAAQGIHFCGPRARFLLGRIAVSRGAVDEGLATMQGAMDETEASSRTGQFTFFALLLAGAFVEAGRPGSEELLEEAFAFAAQSGERHLECELHLLRARSRKQARGDEALVAADFARAAGLAGARGDGRLEAQAAAAKA